MTGSAPEKKERTKSRIEIPRHKLPFSKRENGNTFSYCRLQLVAVIGSHYLSITRPTKASANRGRAGRGRTNIVVLGKEEGAKLAKCPAHERKGGEEKGKEGH